jgi:sulfatase maturation enzyme AslB (radical SAM superfamily)
MHELKSIQLESSTICNGRCVFCPRFDMTRPEGEMTDELFHKIVEEGVEMGVQLISPFLNGEPFLFTRLFEWLDYLKERGINFTLYTNASALTKEKADKINTYTNCVDLIFSMHGYNKESYESQMSLPYDKVKANIEYFVSIAKIPYQIYMLDTSINHEGVNQFLKTWEGSRVFFAKYTNWAGKRPSSMRGSKIPCDRILSEMTIYWDGRVNLCCMDSDAGVVLGDLNKQSIKEVWESNQWMRDKHVALDFDLPLCRNCNKNIL